MQSHREREREEEYSKSFHFPLTSCLMVVMTTFYPRAGAGPLPLEAAGKSGRGGPEGHRDQDHSILKYTASGKCNYKPEEGQSLI